MRPARVIVLGAGAIGAPVGALLHERGVDVVLVARGEHGAALAHHGLDLRTPTGARRLRPPVAQALDSVAPTPEDLVIVSVMGHHTAEAVAPLSPEVPVVSFQNGSAPLHTLAERGHPLLAGLVYVPAERRAPGVVALSGAPHPGAFVIGPWPPAAAPPWAGWLCARLQEVGFQAEEEADMGRWIRAKHLGNLGGILYAVCDAPPRDVLAAAQAEARAVWRAAGLPAETPEALGARIGPLRAAEVDGRPRRGGSTRHALGRGQRLETASLHGRIVSEGARLGVPTPVNAALIALAEEAMASAWAPGCMEPDAVRSWCQQRATP